MGKVKGRRYSHRYNPIEKDKLRDKEEASLHEDEPNSSSLSPDHLVKALHGDNPADKERACRELALAELDRETFRVLTTADNLRVICDITASNDLIRKEAGVSAIKSLTAAADVFNEVDKMVSRPVVQRLVELLRECYAAVSGPQVATPTSERLLWVSITEQCLKVLWNLIDCSDAVVQALQESSLISMFINLMQPNMFSDLTGPAAQCLYSLSEDNVTVSKLILEKDEFLVSLVTILRNDITGSHVILIKAVACGILANIIPLVAEGKTLELTSLIGSVLGSILEIDVTPLLEEILQVFDDKSKAFQKIEEIQTVLWAKQIALEVTANSTCVDDEDEWEDIDEMEVEVQTEVGMEPVANGNHSSAESPLIEMILQHNLKEKVWSSFQTIDSKVALELAQKPHISNLYRKLCDMHVTVVGCLQNLLSSLEPPSWGGAPVITQIWERVFILIQSRDVTNYLMEPCTALLKVLTAVDKEHKLNLVCGIGQLPFFCELMQKALLQSALSTCVNVARIIGSFGEKSEDQKQLQTIAQSYKTLIESSENVWVTSEVLDTVYDTFGGTTLSAQVVMTSSLLSSLQHLQSPSFSKQCSEWLKSERENRSIVEVARDNLKPFIQYINKEVKKK